MLCRHSGVLAVLMMSAVTGCEREKLGAPRVSVSPGRLVTVTWARDRLNTSCQALWDIIVEKEGEKKQVCSSTTDPGTNYYICKLDLSPVEYCGKNFSFYVRLGATRRTEGMISYSAQSVLSLNCGGLSTVTERKSATTSPSCTEFQPFWRQKPLFYRVNPINFRIRWNKRHVENINCVDDFVLKIWDVEKVNQRPNVSRFPSALYGDNFYSDIAVQPCKKYVYSLTAVTESRADQNVVGRFGSSCQAGENSRNLDFQRSLQWNSLPLTNNAILNLYCRNLALILNFVLALELMN